MTHIIMLMNVCQYMFMNICL